MGRPWFLCKRKAAHRWVLAVFTVFICLAQLKTSPGARLEGMCALNEPEPFDWRGESSALILFCSLQSFAHSSVSMGVLHTHSAWWKTQQEVLENPSLGPVSVFRLQTGQERVTVLAKPPWVTLGAGLVQDKPYHLGVRWTEMFCNTWVSRSPLL